MSRVSRDEIRDGAVWNGYDYALQVWVLDGVVQDCGHFTLCPTLCCNARRYEGLNVRDIAGHDRGER